MRNSRAVRLPAARVNPAARTGSRRRDGRETERDLLRHVRRNGGLHYDVAAARAPFARNTGAERIGIVRIARGLVLEKDPRRAVLEDLLLGNPEVLELPGAERLKLLPGLAGHNRDARAGILKYGRPVV